MGGIRDLFCLQQNDLGVDHVLRHIYDSRRLRRQEQIVSNYPAW